MSFIAPVILFLAHFLTMVFLDPAGSAWSRVRRSPPVTALFARLGLAGGAGREDSAMRTPPMPLPAERRSETGAPVGTTSSSDGKF